MSLTTSSVIPAATPVAEPAYAFVGERLWLDFVNTDAARVRARRDALLSFDALLRWLAAAGTLDGERAQGMRRRAGEQPAGATAALVELNRLLGRSAGTRRLELRRDGSVERAFVPVGDAFSTLLIPVVESAADALVLGELPRVRRCAAADCARVFFDGTRNGARRWCDMASCGNRAKAARFRARAR